MILKIIVIFILIIIIAVITNGVEDSHKDYYLYLSNKNEKKMSNYKFNEDEIVKLYNAIKKTLELENLI